jgi:hypothetical protein
MAVGADQRIRIGYDPVRCFLGPDYFRQILEVDLVHDALARRHDPKPVEAALAPPQEAETLGVPLIFKRQIGLPRLGSRRNIDP